MIVTSIKRRSLPPSPLALGPFFIYGEIISIYHYILDLDSQVFNTWLLNFFFWIQVCSPVINTRLYIYIYISPYLYKLATTSIYLRGIRFEVFVLSGEGSITDITLKRRRLISSV